MTHNQNNITARILVIDDSSTILEKISSILRKKNYQIATAKNGRSGLAKAKANNFDLVLLDIVLPDINGYEVCRQLKNFSTTKDIPVIFLTVKEEINSVVKGFEAGGVDYILKPFNEQELCARINIHLELKFSKENIKKELNFNWENKVILVADDIQSVCIFFKNVLQKTKAKILFAKDGVETLNMCRDPEKKIDLVLMDLQMPRLSGLEATKQIRLFDKDIFIIAQTAIATPVEHELALEAGCNNVIFKPINPKELLSLLSQYLDKNSSDANLVDPPKLRG
jgi:DNA-binding response OmpR family regulator